MDRRTVDVYERSAEAYAAARTTRSSPRARALRASLPPAGLCLDLGCGPGHHLRFLGRPTVAADAARAMLDQAAKRARGAHLVQCDLEQLPFRRQSLAGVWASKCHQHVPAERLPMALAELHHATAVGGRLELTMFQGDGTMISDDDFPGRSFTLWQPGDVIDLLVGAGFTVDRVRTPGNAGTHRIEVAATRARTLADLVSAGMRLLCCGLNPSLYAADTGVGYARPGNRFWPALSLAGLTTADRDPRHLLRHDAIGMTDLVKRATPGADALAAEEYRAGVSRIERLCRRLRPGAVCLVGMAGWRAAVNRRAEPGWQPEHLGPSAVYLMPSTSGLNARTSVADLAGHLGAAIAGPDA